MKKDNTIKNTIQDQKLKKNKMHTTENAIKKIYERIKKNLKLFFLKC